jgi:hypothetical protein
MSSDQPPGDLAGSGQGGAALLILRRTGYRVRPNPNANPQIWRSNELNPCVFQRLPNLLNGIKVGLDATFRTLQPTYGRKRQPCFAGQLILSPSEERASCLDLSRVNEHLGPLIPSGNRREIQTPGAAAPALAQRQKAARATTSSYTTSVQTPATKSWRRVADQKQNHSIAPSNAPHWMIVSDGTPHGVGGCRRKPTQEGLRTPSRQSHLCGHRVSKSHTKIR